MLQRYYLSHYTDINAVGDRPVVVYDDALAMIRAAFDAGMDRGLTERYAPWTEYREQWIRENVGAPK